MSIFNDLLSKVLGRPASAPGLFGAPPPPPAPASPTGALDIDAVLSGLAAKHPEVLDWKHSIVDLLKLLGLDSSLGARKELAGELHYAGDTSSTEAMNTWLHETVLQKLAENGGKMPAELLTHSH